MAEDTSQCDQNPFESFGRGAPLTGIYKLLPRMISNYIALSSMMFLALLLTFLFASCFVSASPESDDIVLDAEFDKFVLEVCDALHIPGISVAVINKHSFKSKGYGYAVLPDVEATPDTLWFTGSTTKAFTAAAAALMVQDTAEYPEVSWSSPLSTLLSGDFALQDDYYSSHITLEDALSHRSGLPRHDLAYGWSEGNDPDALDIIRTMKNLPLTAEPRTKWQYCNLMYGTVGQALAMLSGIDFGDVLKKFIWEPIGMRSTTTSTKEAMAARDQHGKTRLSRGYFWNKDHYLPEPYTNLDPLAGAGATISSVNDYALWIQALLNAGTNDTSPINEAIYRDLVGPRTIMSGLFDKVQSFPPLYALGWINIMAGPHEVITHTGSVTGFGANVYILPGEEIGLVSMANTMGSSNQAGALIFIEIMKRLGKVSSVNDTAHLNSLHESMVSYPRANQRLFSANSENHISTGPELPLPGRLADYIGSYHHPAYGVFNVSAVEEKPNHYGGHAAGIQEPIMSTSPKVLLRIKPSDRTWPFEIGLEHKGNTFFATQIYWVHGQGDVGDECIKERTVRTGSSEVKCRQEVFLEPLIEARAVFEHDLNGEVTKLGVELEPEMLQKDDSKWRDGMMWFEKQA
ncbi:beta-lactamase/transpeptidase-like protein, partial [Aureobasidium melanogenum]